MSGDALLYVGVILLASSVLAAIVSFFVLRKESKRIHEELEADYGKRPDD